ADPAVFGGASPTPSGSTASRARSATWRSASIRRWKTHRISHAPKDLPYFSMLRRQGSLRPDPPALGWPAGRRRMVECLAARLALVPRRARPLQSGAAQIRDKGARHERRARERLSPGLPRHLQPYRYGGGREDRQDPRLEGEP